MPIEFKVATYNVSPSDTLSLTENERAKNIAKNLESLSDKLDIALVQGSKENTSRLVAEELGLNGEHASNGDSILYNHHMFECLYAQIFTHRSGEKSLFVDLRCKTTQKVIRVANVHLKKLEGGTDLGEFLTYLKNCPCSNARSPIDYTLLGGHFDVDIGPPMSNRQGICHTHGYYSITGEKQITHPKSKQQLGHLYLLSNKGQAHSSSSLSSPVQLKSGCDHLPLGAKFTLPEDMFLTPSRPRPVSHVKSENSACGVVTFLALCALATLLLGLSKVQSEQSLAFFKPR